MNEIRGTFASIVCEPTYLAIYDRYTNDEAMTGRFYAVPSISIATLSSNEKNNNIANKRKPIHLA